MRKNNRGAVYEQMQEEPQSCLRRDFPLSDATFVAAFSNFIVTPPYPRDCLHYHNCMELGVCLSGSGTILTGDQEIPFSEGLVMLVPKGVYHAQQNAHPVQTHWRYVEINEERLLRETPDPIRSALQTMLAALKNSILLVNDAECRQDVARLMEQMFDWQERLGATAAAEIDAALLLTLARLAQRPGISPLEKIPARYQEKTLNPALAYVAQHYQQEIRMTDLARACAMSESHFRRLFYQATGMNPSDYVNRYRIHRALNLLKMTNDSILAVAMHAGFSSIATFNRNFLHYMGQSPKQWRNSQKPYRKDVLLWQKSFSDSE